MPPPNLCERLLHAAAEAGAQGEIPIAAAIVTLPDESITSDDASSARTTKDAAPWREIALATNQVETLHDPTAHAELRAIQAAAKIFQNERFAHCALVTTLEPCAMCAGAIVLARITRVYYFAPAEKNFGMQRLLHAARIDGTLNHHPEMYSVPQYASRSARLLKDFFQSKRGAASNSNDGV